MRHINILIKPASSLCNMNCAYCFYKDEASKRETASYGIMSDETAKTVVDNIYASVAKNDTVSICFQGGEPTLAGLEWFENFKAYVSEKDKYKNTYFSIQTNALILDDDWCRYLKKNKFLVGVSLDGMKDNHDYVRKDASGNGTYKRVIESIGMLKKYGVEFNVLMTLTNSLARHPAAVWKFIRENGLEYVQFTPCIAPIGGESAYSLTPDRFKTFYTEIFRYWKEACLKGEYYSIKLFDDLISLTAFAQMNACGITGYCSPQIVVESDGSTYPCDFYMLDNWKTGTLKENTLDEIMTCEVNNLFKNRARIRPLCSECRYKAICGGGCERMQESVCYAEGDSICSYKEFLDDIMEDILVIADNMRSRAGK